MLEFICTHVSNASTRPFNAVIARKVLALISCALTLLLLAPSSAALTKVQRNAISNRVRLLLAKKRYREIIPLMLRLYDAERKPNHLLMVARLWDYSKKGLPALRRYEEFLRLDPTTNVRKLVETRIKELRATLAKTHREVVIRSVPSHAAIMLDGRLATERTPSTIWVTLGAHRLSLTHAGFQPYALKRWLVHPGPALLLNVKLVKPIIPGRISVVANVHGARIYLNKALVGRSPVSSLEVTPGRYVLRIEAQGYLPHVEMIVLRPNSELLFRLFLKERPIVVPIVVKKPTRRASRRRMSAVRIWAWVTLGAGVATMATGVGLHFLARKRADSVNALVDSVPIDQRDQSFLDKYNGMVSKVHVANNAGISLMAIGGATLVASTVLFFLRPGTSEKSASWYFRSSISPHSAVVYGHMSF